MFFPPKEVAQNLVMGIPAARRWAQRHHTTGIGSDPARAPTLMRRFEASAGRRIQGARILEIGPGLGTEFIRAALAESPVLYAAFDVEPYLDQDEMREQGVDYRVDPSGALPWIDPAFDIVWSHSVLEHVRDPRRVLEQSLRVLLPGGIHVAEIDLQDHYRDRSNAKKMYAFLKYGTRTWDLMTRNRSTYCNRLRFTDWVQLFREVGFDIVSISREDATCGLDPLREVPYLRSLSDIDLLTTSMMLVARRS